MGKLMLAAGLIALAATPATASARARGQTWQAARRTRPIRTAGYKTVRGNPHNTVYGTPCPPGLANKGCMPPGLAKKMYGTGQRLPSGYRYLAVPDRYRDQIDFNDRYRYYYDDGRVYVVDPRSRLIQDVISLVL